MKLFLTATLILVTIASKLFSQNVDDNKVSFQYIQLPLQKLNPQFTSYEVRVLHTYKKANEDSLLVFEQRKELAEKNYKAQYEIWLAQKKTIDKQYYAQLAQYEKTVNSGVIATAPNPPLYPASPLYIPTAAARTHSDLLDNDVVSWIDLKGFTKGLGGSIITINVLPIRDVKIIETKSGSAATTKYDYKCQYLLPVEVTLETPLEGTVYKKMYFEGIQYHSMKSYSSKYEYQSWLIDNEQQFYKDLERDTRRKAISEINSSLNNEFGFVPMTRSTEIYSINKYKDYGYSDVIEALTLTTQALNQVSKDRNRATAIPKIDLAVSKWKAILEESNMIDDKARINDKITAMIYCNLAELLHWRADFDQSELYVNQALNCGTLKFRNHAERVVGFYAEQKKRWGIHY